MKKLQILFVFCVLAALFLPLLKFNWKGTVSEKEKRTLAVRPYLLLENRLNKNLFGEYDAYFKDRFGGRQGLIYLNSLIDYSLLGKNACNERALKGKKGWYFYIAKADGDNLSDFMKRNLMTDDEIRSFKARVQNAKSWCDGQGIKSLFVIGPNKHSVYEEFYPFPRPDGISRSDQLCKALEEAGVDYIFPRDYLISKKADFDFPLYYETDTHWNLQGAFLAFGLIKEKIKADFPAIDFPEISYKSKVFHSYTHGDILPMLAIEISRSTIPLLAPENHAQSDFYTYLKNEGTKGVHTVGADKSLPRALVFRDSFCTNLEPFLSPLFSEVEYNWRHFSENDKEYILSYKPDIVIFESVERSSLNIVQ